MSWVMESKDIHYHRLAKGVKFQLASDLPYYISMKFINNVNYKKILLIKVDLQSVLRTLESLFAFCVLPHVRYHKV